MTFWKRSAPALTLVLMAPLLAEVLPGSTRLSALFVFPIEMCVWGCGALAIRYAVRRWRLGWQNMVLLAIALAIAEECLIQQTSLAPMVLQLKGQVYARASGVNYVYFLWALVYEPVFVVFLPVYLVELIFLDRREGVWVSTAGLVAVVSLFILGSYLAWYTWIRIARPNVFHVPVYALPPGAAAIAAAAICALILVALGPLRNKIARAARPLVPPGPWSLGAIGALFAALWYGLVLLAFGIAPSFPPWIVVGSGILVAMASLIVLPRWATSTAWNRSHGYALIFGTMLGSMSVNFIGFIWAANADLYFKIVVDVIAAALMFALGYKIKKHAISTM
jgi:hypothetical protein